MEKYYRKKEVVAEIRGMLRDTAKVVDSMPKYYFAEELAVEK